jgi:3-hydroxyisobutyrate dehydrogenase
MRIGFAGLGLMGLPMATNLVRAGIRLAAFNRSRAPRETLRKIGAETYDDPDPFFAACDCVVLMLADDDAVDEVLGRRSPDFERRVGGKLITNMGTHAPAWSKALERDILAAGGRFVEAPVSGSRGPAETGELVALVAGDEEGIEQLRSLLSHLCRQIVRTGAVPSAMECKMAANLYLIASVAALAEAAMLARRLDLPPEAFEQVIGSGPLGSQVSRAKLGKMMRRDFTPQAAVRDVCKNAALVADTAAAAGLDARLLELARGRFEAVLHNGGALLDMAAVITAYEAQGEGAL